ncbi:MAG: hypothetical protein ABI348_01680 [Nitrososphaera sp.]|jgi:hypothetical protein
MQVCGVLLLQTVQDLYERFCAGRYSCMTAKSPAHNKSNRAPRGEGEGVVEKITARQKQVAFRKKLAASKHQFID